MRDHNPKQTTFSRKDIGTMPRNNAGTMCDDILILKEKVAAIEAWRSSTEADLKEIREVMAQVKLLITLSIGGGGLSIIALILTITRMVNP
ncbi:MAG: hypothetical protein WC935_02175 [Thermoleophilia bacterium]